MSGDLPDIGSVKTAQIDGLQIRFARISNADEIPVLLTSPWPESIYAFRDVLFEIGKLNPLIAIDLPGYGRSEGRPDVMPPEAMGIFYSQGRGALRRQTNACDWPGCGYARIAVCSCASADRFRESHLIWEDAPEEYAANIVSWLKGGYRSV
jgi:pimeloyl-ACP methyl ester carboxylesterase